MNQYIISTDILIYCQVCVHSLLNLFFFRDRKIIYIFTAIHYNYGDIRILSKVTAIFHQIILLFFIFLNPV